MITVFITISIICKACNNHLDDGEEDDDDDSVDGVEIDPALLA
jgi:hypothetical protein